MPKFKVVWDQIIRERCIAEVEAEDEIDAKGMVHDGDINDDDPEYLSLVDVENIRVKRLDPPTTYLGRMDKEQKCVHGVLISEKCGEC